MIRMNMKFTILGQLSTKKEFTAMNWNQIEIKNDFVFQK